jgi:hypothetical protein
MATVRASRRTRARLLPELVLVVGAGWALYGILTAIKGNTLLFSFSTLLERAPDSVWYRFLWLLGDTNEAQFYASVVAGAAILAGAYLAYRLDRANSRWRGFPITYGTGLWPWVLAASLIGLAISVAIYGFILSRGEWIPTFVPFVSIPVGVVLVYGGGWRNALTGAVLGGLIGFPIAYGMIKAILQPVKFPAVIGNVTGMWLGGIIVFELCHRVLPWMRRKEEGSAGGLGEAEVAPRDRAEDVGAIRDRDAASADDPIEAADFPTREGGAPLERGEIPERAPERYDEAELAAMDRRGWLVRRTLADFSEAQFYGNELASAALLGGVILSWALDSREAVYGSGLLPAVLVSQVMASALGIVLYHDRWRRLEWYPTFVPVVSVAPAVVLSYGGGVAKIFAGAVLGALIGPPIAQFGIDRIPDHWHLYVANTFSMAVTTAIVVAVLLPLPGFSL